MVGKTLGHYEILEPLGKGGMGEVYRARDTKLDRDVAIKVLPEEFIADPDRLARLEREAHLLAALNHANIATIHALEEDQGARFLVMELVKGESLEQRLSKGPLPVDKALELCREIAEALEAAHGEGIIHRDLKPANILITPEEKAKVLDFGIAKSMELGDDVVSDTAKATNLTVAGTLVGTPAYMSPEQIRGEAIDKRADIWAFGCLLYEMLTGRSAFAKETMADTLAAIIDHEPMWSLLPETTPAKVGDLVRRCLHKDPRRRMRDIGDARIEIEEALSEPPGGLVSAAPAVLEPVLWRRALPWGLAAIVVTGALAGAAALRFMAPNPAAGGSTKRFALELSSIDRLVDVETAFSPDGRDLVYVGGREGSRRLYHRPLDSLEASLISGTDGATQPFFSPDGTWIGFYSEGQIKKVPLTGGSPIPICETDTFRGASWGADDTIVFSRSSGLALVSASGGSPEELTTVSPESGDVQRDPYFLPTGQHVLFTVEFRSAEPSRVELLDLSTSQHSSVLQGRDVEYTVTGHLVYLSSDSLIGTLLAVPFDLEKLAVTGEPMPVVEDVQFDPQTRAEYHVANDGTLLYVPTARREVTLVWVTRDGKTTPASDEVARYRYPALSPDGTRVAVSVTTLASRDVWVYDLVRGGKTRLTTGANAVYPTWNSDGTHVTFRMNDAMYEAPADGSGEPTVIFDRAGVQSPMSWSSNGSIAFTEGDMAAGGRVGGDIWVLPPDGEPTVFVQTPQLDTSAMFSPDGRFIAYVSGESDRDEVYVQEYPGPGPKWTISTEGGRAPRWARDGKELFYRHQDKVMVVQVETEPKFNPGTPELLFSGDFSPPSSGGNPYYDVAPDGDRFLMLADPGGSDMVVVVNWFEELKRLVPTGGR